MRERGWGRMTFGRWIALALAAGWFAFGGGAFAQDAAPPAVQPQGDTLTGQRISLDLKGVDILDVLKLLSQKSGLNFVAGRNVAGRVTTFVSDVDVWQAFERIIDANDLAYERQGGIVTVMAARDYELIYGEKFQERKQRLVVPLKYAKAVQVANALNQLKSSVGQVVVDEASNTLVVNDVPGRLEQMQEVLGKLDRPTRMQVYHLNYTDAEKLKEKIQDMLTPIGTVAFDVRTNTAIVTDLAEVVDRVDQVVRAIDTPDGQVLIEAKIVKVNLTDDMDLGIDWQRVFAGIRTTLGANFDVISGDVIGGTATGGALKVVSARTDSEVVIEALKKITKTDTLASPRIMVGNKQEAKILVGTKEAFVTTTTTVPATGSTVTAPEIQFVDVGTKLFVTPIIKRNGYVQLEIRPEVSSAETVTFADNRIPIVTSTEAETTVMVKSGVTVIIGGLIEENNVKTQNKVPWLGEIPVLGLPFRGTTNTKDKTELVVFMTPQIVMPDGSPYVPPPDDQASEAAAAPSVVLKEPVSASYRQRVRQHLQERLIEAFHAASLEHGSVVVSFVLSHDGRVAGQPTITSPEGSPFILAAKMALERAQPFPSFPEGSEASEVRFKLAVEYAPQPQAAN